MINEQRVLAVIPARGGSKGLPGKNTATLCGLPLIAWTIAAARDSVHVDRVIVTTDDRDIADVAARHGAEVPFLRPAELAGDDTPGIGPVLHACRRVPGYDWVAVLQPTSPLRTGAHLDAALALTVDRQANFCVSVARVRQHPNWMYRTDDHGFVHRYERAEMSTDRQSLVPLFAPNGAIYVGKVPSMLERESLSGPRTVAFEMREEDSVDVDTAFDLGLCEWLMSNRASAPSSSPAPLLRHAA